MINKILEIDNDYIAECIFKRMNLDFSEATDEEFIVECRRAADEFADECANAVQGS
jgi:hypothetical protein